MGVSGIFTALSLASSALGVGSAAMNMFGGGKAPAAPELPAPKAVDFDEERRKVLRRKGMGATNLTGGSAVTGAAGQSNDPSKVNVLGGFQ
ncbi:MAG: hypothetical protein ACNI27_03720 [Desulfovibrio sp.]